MGHATFDHVAGTVLHHVFNGLSSDVSLDPSAQQHGKRWRHGQCTPLLLFGGISRLTGPRLRFLLSTPLQRGCEPLAVWRAVPHCEHAVLRGGQHDPRFRWRMEVRHISRSNDERLGTTDLHRASIHELWCFRNMVRTSRPLLRHDCERQSGDGAIGTRSRFGYARQPVDLCSVHARWYLFDRRLEGRVLH